MVQKSFTDDTAVIYGVISHGKGCAFANLPGINTRVTKYINWIKERMSLPTPPTTIMPIPTPATKILKGESDMYAIIYYDHRIDQP